MVEFTRLMADPHPDLSRIADAVAREIVSTKHRHDGSFISTPLLYPSGSTVVVKIHQAGEQFFISDIGLGYQEADMMGAGSIYARHARVIAENAGIRFDSQSFFIRGIARPIA